MLYIKKILLIRVIALFLSISIALPGNAYSLSDARPETLRLPVGSPQLTERQQETQRRLFLEKYNLLRFLTQEETAEYLATVDEVVSIHTGRTMSRARVQQLIEEGEVSIAEKHDGTRVVIFTSELKSSEVSQVKTAGEIPLIEKIANELIEQGVYDPIPSSKMKLEELFEEIERTERALEGDVQTGLLAGSIDQIKATEMFRQGHVVFIPRSEETLCVISDIHGDLTSLNRTLEEIDFVNNMKSKKSDIRLVILGDYINDGINSLGVLLRVMQLKRDYPKHVILLRGNHEVERDDSVKVDDFRKEEEKILSSEEAMLNDLGYIKQHSYFIFELIAKYGLENVDEIYERFLEFFKQLPAVAVTSTGIVMAHAAPPHDPNNSLLDIAESDELAYEMRANSTWTDKDAPNELITSGYKRYKIRKQGFLEFMRNIGGRIFIGGHVSINSGAIQYDGKMVILHSQNVKSRESGHYFYSQGVGSGCYALLSLSTDYNVFSQDYLKAVPDSTSHTQAKSGEITPPAVGHVEPIADAYTALQAGRHDEARALVMEGLLGEDFVVNIETAIGILEVLITHYGAETERGEKIASILPIVIKHKDATDQTEMKRELESGSLASKGTLRLEQANPLVRRGEGLLLEYRLDEAFEALSAAQAHYEKVLAESEVETLAAEARQNLAIVANRLGRIAWQKKHDTAIDVYSQKTGEPTGEKVPASRIHHLGKFHAVVGLVGLTPQNTILLQERGSDKYMFPSTRTLTVGGAVESSDKGPLEAVKREMSEEMGLAIEQIDESRLRKIVLDGNKAYDQPVFFKMYEFTALSESEYQALLSIKDRIEQEQASTESDPLRRVLFNVHPTYRIVFMYVFDTESQGRLEDYRNKIEIAAGIPISDYIINYELKAVYTYQFTEEEMSRIRPDTEEEDIKGFVEISPEELAKTFKEHPDDYSDVFIPVVTDSRLWQQVSDIFGTGRNANLNDLKQTVVLFSGDEIMRPDNPNPDGFKQALDELDGTNTIVVVTDLKQEFMDFCIDHGIDIGMFFIRTPAEIGLAGFNLEQAMSLIMGIDNLRCVPLTDSLCDSYEALKKARDQV